MAGQPSFVIVGAGLAGAKAAETLRGEGFDGAIVLIGDEPERPYERPPLSKNLLLGTAARDSVYVHHPAWYAEHEVELRTDVRVSAVHRDQRRVALSDGRFLGYEALLLATGGTPRALPVPGADLDGVLSLRTLADADRVAGALTAGANLVIIGAGWIGLEVAAAARQRGATVTIVETAELPLRRVLGDRVGTVFAELHRDHGVSFRFGGRTSELRGDGRVSHVVLTDGTVLPADTVLIAVGVRPNTELAESAGLRVDDGIVVDRRLCTDDPRIYAAGDVAAIDHPLLRARIRVEHWANALHSGPAAARAMLGQAVSYDRLPYFYTDQYDLGMEYSGWVPPGGQDQVIIRGDLGKREFIAFWTAQDRVLAAMTVNVWDHTDAVASMVRAGLGGARVDPAALADPDTPLGQLAMS